MVVWKVMLLNLKKNKQNLKKNKNKLLTNINMLNLIGNVYLGFSIFYIKSLSRR